MKELSTTKLIVGLCAILCVLVFLIIYSIKNKEYLAFTLTPHFWKSFFLGSFIIPFMIILIAYFISDMKMFEVVLISLPCSIIFSIIKKFSEPVVLEKKLAEKYYYHNLFFVFILCIIALGIGFRAVLFAYLFLLYGLYKFI